jgi:ABC-2 type transport system ATP-binding protein
MISLKQFELKYRESERILFNGTCMDIGAGDLVGIIGPNGAGKTSLFHVLAGCPPPKAEIRGSVKVNCPLDSRTIVLQNAWLPTLLTVWELIELVLALNLEHKATAKEEFFESLDEINLERLDRLGDVRFGRLSTGEQQWLVVALGLFNSQSLALLDEPTSGLDPASRYLIWQSIHHQRTLGKTILVSSHLIDEISEQVDYFYLLKEGGVERFDDASHFRKTYAAQTSDQAFVKAFHRGLLG